MIMVGRIGPAFFSWSRGQDLYVSNVFATITVLLVPLNAASLQASLSVSSGRPTSPSICRAPLDDI